MKRPNGYYWVLYMGAWIPACYDGIEFGDGFPWTIVGSRIGFNESKFEKIGRKIDPDNNHIDDAAMNRIRKS